MQMSQHFPPPGASDRMYRSEDYPGTVRTPLRRIGEAAGAAFQSPVDLLFPGSTAAAEAFKNAAAAEAIENAARAAFQSPADLVLPGSTAAGKAAADKARKLAEKKLEDAGRSFGKGAAEGAGDKGKSLLGPVLLGLLGLGVVGGGIYALSKA